MGQRPTDARLKDPVVRDCGHAPEVLLVDSSFMFDAPQTGSEVVDNSTKTLLLTQIYF